MAEDEKIADKTQKDVTSQNEDAGDSGSINAPQSDHKEENFPENKQMVISESAQSGKSHELADDAELGVESSRNDDECDLMLDELMETLDVVDSWVDTADDEFPSDSFDKSDGNMKDSSKSDKTTKPNDTKSKNTSSRRDSSDQKKNTATSKDKKNNENAVKSSSRSDHEKKTGRKESSESNRNRSTVRRGRSTDRTSRRSRDVESGNRGDRSANRSSKPGDHSKKNTDRDADGFSSSSRRGQASRPRRSRTRSKERDSHYTATKNTHRSRNYQTGKELPRHSDRSASSRQKQDRNVNQEKRSAKDRISSGKAIANPSTTVKNKNTDNNQLKFEKVSPSPEDLVPPGTEDDLSLRVGKYDKDKIRSPQRDALVPPGTEDVLLPGSRLSKEKDEINSSKKRKLSSTDNKRRFKLSTEKEMKNDDERPEEKRRRLSSTEEGKRREPCMDRDRIARDVERISRELSLERLRESRNRERFDRGRYQSRERYSPSRRLREDRARRSASFGRLPNIDSRWDTSSRDRCRRRGDLSPISPGRMSRGSPLSFEFSPVSSRSSSRERLRIEYQRNKFRSYSPISSGSDLSRSMLPISSDDEREPRSRRRRRLPFLDEMERKLGLKLTGGHNINQQLRTSRQFPVDRKIDMSAPPPGIYPMNFPPPVQYPAPTPAPVPFPAAVNPVYPPIVPVPTPPFVPGPMVRTDHPPNAPTAPPATCLPPANNSQSNPPAERQLVTIPREPLKAITFKFQRPTPSQQQPEVPEAPPPPTISAGAVTGELSLSSLLEASVKVGGKNPVDEARLERCAVAIQTLQEDESFSMITLGRFVVQETPDKARYSSIARFDHPAQESLFKLKSPLLRNQLVNLKFTTPSVIPLKPSSEQIAVDKSADLVVRKSSIWPKNSERKLVEKKVVPTSEHEEEDDEDDVCIVEKPSTVVSISSESDHDMNLSLVSDISDVSADEADDDDDKLENVSSGEEDFNNQCYTCAECNRVKNVVDASTQYESCGTRNMVVQVDFVNQQLMGTCDVLRSFGDPAPSLDHGGHSNASSISSCSSNELRSASPSVPSHSHAQKPLTDPFPDDVSTSARRLTAQSFLESVTDNSYQPSANSSSQSSNLGSFSSYKPFVDTANQFSNSNSPSLPSNRFLNQLNTNINSPVNTSTNKSFQDSPGITSTQNYSGAAPFRSSFSTLGSGNSPGSVSKSEPIRGILKSSHPANVQSSLTASMSASPGGSSFQRDSFQSTKLYQGGSSLQDKPQPYGNQGAMNQSIMGKSPFLGANMSRSEQPLPFRNQSSQIKPGIGGQSFQTGSLFDNVATSKPQGPQSQPFRGVAGSQRQQDTLGRTPFQGGSGLGNPFSNSPVSQNQSFLLGNSKLSVTGNMGTQSQHGPFQSSGSFGQQPMSSDFGTRFGNAGNRPAMVPPPTPVPAPTLGQQTFPRPSAGPRLGSTPVRMNQTYFGTTPRQQSNYYERKPY